MAKAAKQKISILAQRGRAATARPRAKPVTPPVLGSRAERAIVRTAAPLAGSVLARRTVVTRAAVEAAGDDEVPKVFGIALPEDKTAQLTILSVCALGSSILFAFLQEQVTTIPGFKKAGGMTLMTLFQGLTFAFCAFVEMFLVQKTIAMSNSWKNYWILAGLTFGGMELTNQSLRYISYATRVVAKSAKVIPTMLMAFFINKKTFSLTEVLSAFTLVAGITLFMLGDAAASATLAAEAAKAAGSAVAQKAVEVTATSPLLTLVGIAFVSTAIVVDSTTANFEEKYFFRVEKPSSLAEVLGYSYLLGTLFTLFTLYSTGFFLKAFQFALANPVVVPQICAFGLFGYISTSFVLSIIKFFGATEAEVIKSIRKIGTIVVSFALIPKPINWQYVVGFTVVVVSTIVTFNQKQAKIKAKMAAKTASVPAEENVAEK